VIFAVGDRVRLLRLEDEFFRGIDLDDVARLKGLVGRDWTVSDFSEHGYVEIELHHPEASSSPTPIDWICIPPSWIERAS
jgi:hypothetical protein